MRIVRILVSVALMAGVAACGDDDGGSDSRAADNTLSITARDYAFEVSGDAQAGVLTIDVSNEGDELHEIAMGRLEDGKTLDDLREALAAADPEDEDALRGILAEDSVIDELGGVQLPGTSYGISGSGIEAGEYALLCFIPNAEGTPHHQLGMLTGFTVGEDEVEETPAADVMFTATDDALEGPDELEAGRTIVEVVNDSSVNREIAVLKLSEGKSMADVGAWFESGGDGAPDPAKSPLDFLAFIFDAEQDRFLTLDFSPGEWAIQSADPEMPFEGSPADDPHAIIFTVR